MALDAICRWGGCETRFIESRQFLPQCRSGNNPERAHDLLLCLQPQVEVTLTTDIV
ncbi:hypothetical protein NEOLEDRAFT_1139513, partial [Neolentinus lepideus HHB14362 ss-1]